MRITEKLKNVLITGAAGGLGRVIIEAFFIGLW
jgi:NAD(P)-dependent dehydrogenase (short-subunit alcohol dehydrogenase family)